MIDKQPEDAHEGGFDQSRKEAELIGRIIQSEQKLSDYFVNIITKTVTDQLEQRNMLRLRIGGIVFVFALTVAIPTVIFWIRGTIAEQTESALAVQIGEASENLEGRFEDFLEQERMYSSFTNYLLYLSDRTSVARSELAEVRVRLEEVERHPEIIERADFPYLLDLITRLAVKHNDKDVLKLLESAFVPQMTSPRTMPRLARYYGERVLGDRFISETKRQTAARRFQQYLNASEQSPDFESLLPLQLMVDDQLNTDESGETFAAVRLHVQELGEDDKASFIAETVRYSNPQFWEAPTTARTRRIAGVAGKVVIDHRDFYIELLDNVAVQTTLIDISEAEVNKGNVAFATALSGFRNAFSGELASTDDKEFRSTIKAVVKSDIAIWMQDKVIIQAINAQNRESAELSRQEIQDLEKKWKSEFESGAFELIESVQERPVSRLLRRVKRDSIGMYREIYVMDNIGLIVGASDPNNDYWQGDEQKWLESYGGDADSMHIGTLAFDESALAWVIEISLPILDPDSGISIGAVSVDLDPSMLESSI